nr:hypothetical protein [Angustibacter aerolatus]
MLIENVTHHMDEEEQDWFPKVREGLSRKQPAGDRRPDARACASRHRARRRRRRP